MTIKVTTLDGTGHTSQELSKIEVEELLDTQGYKYYVVDAKTRKIMKEITLEDGQELYLMPMIAGG